MTFPGAEWDRIAEHPGMPYEQYLHSEAWRQRRAIMVERADHRCQLCNSGGRLEVHHRTYARLGAERPEDLIVLCHTCHATFHATGQLSSSVGVDRWKQVITIGAAIACFVVAGYAYFTSPKWSEYHQDPASYLTHFTTYVWLIGGGIALLNPSDSRRVLLGTGIVYGGFLVFIFLS